MFDQSKRQTSSRAPRMEASKDGMRRRPLEQSAVDVGKPRQILVERLLALLFRGVQHLEQFGQPCSGVRSVLGGAVLKQVQEDVPRLEDARVVGEQAEHDPNQEPLQVVASVARLGQGRRAACPRARRLGC